MKNKTRLISLMLAGSIATAGLTACSGEGKVYANDIPERRDFTLEMSLEIGQMLTNVVSFEVTMNENKYYIRFLAHFDKGKSYIRTTRNKSYYEYIDHKDHWVTYEISEEDYKEFMQFCSPAQEVKLADLPLEKIPTLQAIIDNYEPFGFAEAPTDDDHYGSHSR